MIVEHCQRWELGRAHKRPAGEVVRRSDGYEVAPIADVAAAKAFVELHHYSHSASSPAHPFGLWLRGELVGVALFGPPASMNAHRAVFPTLDIDEAVTLGRLILRPEVPSNGETLLVSQCFRLLRNPRIYRPLNPDGSPRRRIVGVESCADPVARIARDGRRVMPGHGGTVYQALSALHPGRTNRATKYLLPDGTELSNKAQGKINRAEQGRRYSGGILVEYGADPLRPGEDPRAWLKLWRARLTKSFRHPGCLRYVWSLDPHRRREVLDRFAPQPYPKIDLCRTEVHA
jgi:hypothetical protein